MKMVFKLILALVIVLGIAAAAIMLRPVEVSQVIWPLVEAVALDDFVGITEDGHVQTGLFKVAPTGVSTAPVVAAARDFLATLSVKQREQVMFAVDDDEWRRWANIHISTRLGVGFGEMTASQQEAAWALVAAGLSARGYALARDITRLEEHLAELKNDHYQYGEHRYWVTMMGEPAVEEPWGWQFEGHHLIINFFVLGDQVVMTPTFMGSEPVIAISGKYQGTSVLQAEQAMGLALINSLSDVQRAQAIIGSKTGNNNQGELFRDNAVVPAQGLPLAQLQGEPRRLAEQLIRTYVGNLRPGHAEVWMGEILLHWQDTYLTWIGDVSDEAVFYYRIFSPVIMIEFDHQTPVALDGPKAPSRRHVHTVVRTPNGNDYGNDLLRQHLAEHPH
jgi:hypothetical protein